jgi:hypothetical protein
VDFLDSTGSWGIFVEQCDATSTSQSSLVVQV